MKSASNRRQAGAALVIALGVTVLLASLSAALVIRGMTERRHARAFTVSDQAVIAADAGLNRVAATFLANHLRLVRPPDPNNPPDPNFPFVFEVHPVATEGGVVTIPTGSRLAGAPAGRVMGFPTETNPLALVFAQNTLAMSVNSRRVENSYWVEILRRSGARPSPGVIQAFGPGGAGGANPCPGRDPGPTGPGSASLPRIIEVLVQSRGATNIELAGRVVETWLRLSVHAESIYDNAIASGEGGMELDGLIEILGGVYARGPESGGRAVTVESGSVIHSADDDNEENDDRFETCEFDDEDIPTRFRVFGGDLNMRGNAIIGSPDEGYFHEISVDGSYDGSTATRPGRPFYAFEVSVAPGTDVPDVEFPEVMIPGAGQSLHIDPDFLDWGPCEDVPPISRSNDYGYIEFDPCTGELEIGGQVVLTPAPASGVITLGTRTGPWQNRYYEVTPVVSWRSVTTGQTITQGARGGGLFVDVGPTGTVDLATTFEVVEDDLLDAAFGLYTNGNMRMGGDKPDEGSWYEYEGLYIANGWIEVEVGPDGSEYEGTLIGGRGVRVDVHPDGEVDFIQKPGMLWNMPPGAPLNGSTLKTTGALGFFGWRQVR